MNEILAVVGLMAAAFAATNLDNLVLLVVLFGDRSFRSRDILFGYGLVAVSAAALAFAAARGIDMAPSRYLGLLGIIPIGLGLARLRDLFRTPRAPRDRVPRGHAGFLSVALMMAAQSADSFAVYVSVFADTQNVLEGPALLTLAASVLLWCLAARWLARKSRLAIPLERVSGLIIPTLLIVIGLYILMDTGTDIGPITGILEPR